MKKRGSVFVGFAMVAVLAFTAGMFIPLARAEGNGDVRIGFVDKKKVAENLDLAKRLEGAVRNELAVKEKKIHALESWKRTLAIDLDSVFYVTRLAVAEMVKNRVKGVVINVSSIAASGNAGQSAYTAAKGALNALTVTWARELGAFGIRVAGLAPGFADTDSTREALSDSILQHIKQAVPLKRLARPAEIAAGALSILENDFYNGRILEVDGGLRL